MRVSPLGVQAAGGLLSHRLLRCVCNGQLYVLVCNARRLLIQQQLADSALDMQYVCVQGAARLLATEIRNSKQHVQQCYAAYSSCHSNQSSSHKQHVLATAETVLLVGHVV